MTIIDHEALSLLDFQKIKNEISLFTHSEKAKQKTSQISIIADSKSLIIELNRVSELNTILSNNGFFPNLQFEDFKKEVTLLSLEGSMLVEEQFFLIKQSAEIANTLIRFLKTNKNNLPFLNELVSGIDDNKIISKEVDAILDFEMKVKDNASKELQKIRHDLREKRKESDLKFNRYANELKKLGFLRENEESYFNGRRTLAVLAENKGEVTGFVHSKSETGKTIFIEPSALVNINNDVAELEIDERREINKILRELTTKLRVFSPQLNQFYFLLIEVDVLRAKALYAQKIKACLPLISLEPELKLEKAFHPILFIQNQEQKKTTIPLTVHLHKDEHLLVISGPNAGGKSVTLKTIGLLQTMLQCGLLVSVGPNSVMSFFNHILIDIGDTQSIEHELSTYSARLKKMISILNTVTHQTLVLIDEFGSGTDPDLGGAMAEVVLEEIVKSKTFGIITTHYSNVKLLANKLDGVKNGSMLFDLETLDPKYILSVGEPGSSYTFEVAERVGFPIDLINRAKLKTDTNKVDLNNLLAEVQQQKTILYEAIEKTEHENFLQKISKEKYEVLSSNYQEKIERERERKIELARLADFGHKYLKLLDDWNKNENRKEVIKRFIDGISAETRKRKDLEKQNRIDKFSEKKVARIKPLLQTGTKVKILNSSQIGIVDEILNEKVKITSGNLKMTVNIHNLEIVRD